MIMQNSFSLMVWNCCLLGALLALQTKGLRRRLGLSVQLRVLRREEILLLSLQLSLPY